MLAPKHPAQPGRQRRADILESVDSLHRWARWRWQGGNFIVAQLAMNGSPGDLCYLISIDEAQSAMDLDHDAVEEIQLWNLQDVLNRPEPGTC
jgi:hypothetical protein